MRPTPTAQEGLESSGSYPDGQGRPCDGGLWSHTVDAGHGLRQVARCRVPADASAELRVLVRSGSHRKCGSVDGSGAAGVARRPRTPVSVKPQWRGGGRTMKRVFAFRDDGTGRSSAIAVMRRVGFPVIGTDDRSCRRRSRGRQQRCESRLQTSSKAVGDATLDLCGCAENQGKVSPQLTAILRGS
jgi:hypothetical protein